MNFVAELLEATKEIETPQIFIKWAGLSAISAVLRRNVWIHKRGGLQVFPNMYVIIVAKSGLLRKSYAPILTRKLVKAAKVTKVIPDRSSIQKMVTDLALVYTYPTGEMVSDASGLLAYPELNAGIIQDPASQTIMTALYDSNYDNEFLNATKISGNEALKDFYLTLIGATNHKHLNDFLDHKSIEGGFVARTMFVSAERKSNINSLIGESDEEDQKIEILFDIKKFVEFLRGVSKLKGIFSLTPGFRKVFNEWYKEYNEQLEIKDPDITGTSSRIHDHILKTSICLAVSDNFRMSADEDIFYEAYDLCFECMGNTRRIVDGKGGGELSPKIKIVMDELLNHVENGITRQQLLSRHYGDFDFIDLDKVIETLVQAEHVKIERNYGKGGPIYRLHDKVIEEYNTLFRKIERQKSAN